MRKAGVLKRSLMIVTMVAFLTQIAACGTILYPERRGQTGGRIDVGVAVLDGVCLLLFLVPGVVAFAVDFATGAIYLPRGRASSQSGAEGVKVVRVDPAELDEEAIKRIVSREAGISATFDLGSAELHALSTTEEIPAAFAEIEGSGVLGG